MGGVRLYAAYPLSWRWWLVINEMDDSDYEDWKCGSKINNDSNMLLWTVLYNVEAHANFLRLTKIWKKIIVQIGDHLQYSMLRLYA